MKPGESATTTGDFPILRARSTVRSIVEFGGEGSSHNFDQRQDRRRIEEVHSDCPIRRCRARRR